jgi:hypothetical protein
VVLAALGLIVVMGLWLSANSAAFGDPRPRRVPVAVVAPSDVIRRLDAGPVRKVRPAGSLFQARRLVEDRAVYGALVWENPSVLQVNIASGAGRPVGMALISMATGIANDSKAALTVVDVAPLNQHDSAGTVEFYAIVLLRSGAR